jgi:hypothetical protein
MSQCKSCGAEIIWAKTVKEKSIPLNDPPEKRFMLVRITNVQEGNYLEARMVDTYISHFATCPDADKHRKADAQTSRRSDSTD